MPSHASRQSLARHRQVKKFAFRILRADWLGRPCFLLNMIVTLTETAYLVMLTWQWVELPRKTSNTP